MRGPVIPDEVNSVLAYRVWRWTRSAADQCRGRPDLAIEGVEVIRGPLCQIPAGIQGAQLLFLIDPLTPASCGVLQHTTEYAAFREPDACSPRVHRCTER